MLNSCCRWIWIVALVGCGSPMEDDVPPPPPDHPDAEPAGLVCEHDSCGLPGDDPCCSGTSCSNWDLLGEVECAAQCETNADCDTGCCVELSNGQHTCGPAGFCDAGGALPEYVCNERLECGEIASYNQCVASITACVGDLSNDQQRQWMDAMYECGDPQDDNSCDSYYTYCWLNYVPWC